MMLAFESPLQGISDARITTPHWCHAKYWITFGRALGMSAGRRTLSGLKRVHRKNTSERQATPALSTELDRGTPIRDAIEYLAAQV